MLGVTGDGGYSCLVQVFNVEVSAFLLVMATFQ